MIIDQDAIICQGCLIAIEELVILDYVHVGMVPCHQTHLLRQLLGVHVDLAPMCVKMLKVLEDSEIFVPEAAILELLVVCLVQGIMDVVVNTAECTVVN